MTSPIEAAEELSEQIREQAVRTEVERRVPDELVAAMAKRGLLRLCTPAVYGGLETDPVTLVRTLEALGRADGSTAWIAMIAATSGAVAFYLPEEGGREIYASDPEVFTAGVFAPQGRAQAVEGGHTLSGRWAFASGCEHAQWLMGGAIPEEDDHHRLMFFPADQAEILDTWHVSGLRGTGSHDMVVEDVFVPIDRQAQITGVRPRLQTPLSAFPVFGLLAVGIAAVSLGIAAAALSELLDLSGVKMPQGSRRRLAERPGTHIAMATAEAELRAARSFLESTLDDVWQTAVAAGEITDRQKALVRLAATHATRRAAGVVDAMYELGGGTSIYESSPLQRHFRDVHAATQHMMVASPSLELVGRVLLGLETDTSQL